MKSHCLNTDQKRSPLLETDIFQNLGLSAFIAQTVSVCLPTQNTVKLTPTSVQPNDFILRMKVRQSPSPKNTSRVLIAAQSWTLIQSSKRKSEWKATF